MTDITELAQLRGRTGRSSVLFVECDQEKFIPAVN